MSGQIGVLTREHRDLIDVIKVTISFAIKRSPEVGDEDLSSLEYLNSSTIKAGFISEAVKVVSEKVDKHASTAVRGVNEFDHRAIETLQVSQQG